MNRDFRALMDAPNTRQGLADLVNAVKAETKQYYRGLTVPAKKVTGPAAKNVLLLLMYIVMRKRSATDWGSGKQLTIDEIESVELHHIFPVDYMNKSDFRDAYLNEGHDPAEYRQLINEIANLTFLSKPRNISIGDQPPSLYLPNETTEAVRRAHFIPEDPRLWKTENFLEFLNERRRLLAKAMTALIKKL